MGNFGVLAHIKADVQQVADSRARADAQVARVVANQVRHVAVRNIHTFRLPGRSYLRNPLALLYSNKRGRGSKPEV